MPRSSMKVTKKNQVVPLPAQYNNNSVVHHTTEKPSLLQTMKEGFGFGLGSSVAINMINSMFRKDTNNSNSSIHRNNEMYTQCMKDFNDDKAVCEKYLDSE